MNLNIAGHELDLAQLAKYAPAIKQARKLARNKNPQHEDYARAASAIARAAGSPIDLTDEKSFVASVKKLAEDNGVKGFDPEAVIESVRDLSETGDQRDFLSKAPDVIAQSGIPKISEAAAVISLIVDSDDEGNLQSVHTEGSAKQISGGPNRDSEPNGHHSRRRK